MTNDLVHGLLEVGDEALWIWSHAFIASTLGAQRGSNEDIGVREYELRVRAENGQSLSFKVTAEIRAAGTSVLKIPTIHIPVPDPTVICLELLDGENWRVLKSKKVLLPWLPAPKSRYRLRFSR
jgi:hypothetical protein